MFVKLYVKSWMAAGRVKANVSRFRKNTDGVTALEYAVLAAVVIAAVAWGLEQFDIHGLFKSAADSIDSAKSLTDSTP